MIDIDVLVRDFRSGVHEPVLPSAAVVAAGAAADHHLVGGGRARQLGRWAMVGAGVLASAGLAGLLLALLIASPKQVAQSGVARADWGRIATVRIDPSPGVSLETATTQAIDALAARAGQDDLPGFSVVPAGAGRLTLIVPAARIDGHVREFVSFMPITLYDRRDVLARGRTLRDLRAAILQRAPQGTKPTRYAIGPNIGGYAGVARTAREKFLLERTFRNPGGAFTIPLPEGLTVASSSADGGAPEILLLRARPIARSLEISGIRRSGPSLVLRLAAAARTRVATALAGGASRGVVVVADNFGLGYNVFGELDVAGSRLQGAELAVPIGSAARADGYAGRAGTTNLASRLTVEESHRYGTIPLPTGVEVAAADPGLRAFRVIPAPGERFFRVLDGAIGSITFRAFASQTPNGERFLYVLRNGRRSNALGRCEWIVGAPVVQFCSAGGSSAVWTYTGQVGAGVASVEARLGSQEPIRGVVQNGFFVVTGRFTRVHGADDGFPTLTARAADGSVIKTLTF